MEHIESVSDLHAAVTHAEAAWREYSRQREIACTQIADWQRYAAELDTKAQHAYRILIAAKAELNTAETHFNAPLSDLDAQAAQEEAEAIMTACYACGCAEDDHRFGEAYQRLVMEDNGARRDGPNPCLDCGACERDPQVED